MYFVFHSAVQQFRIFHGHTIINRTFVLDQWCIGIYGNAKQLNTNMNTTLFLE